VYSLLIGLAVGAVLFGITAMFMSPLAGVLPAVLAVVVILFLQGRKAMRAVQEGTSDLQELAQARQIDAIRARLESLKAQWGKWQIGLSSQLDNQLGMLTYSQQRFDEALPLLSKGWLRDWSVQVSEACIHWRNGDKEKANELFDKATGRHGKQTTLWVVWATLLSDDGQRDEALKVVGKGLSEIEGSPMLRSLRQNLANKRPIDKKAIGEQWVMFFPEQAQQVIGGRNRFNVPPGRGGFRDHPNPVQAPRVGAKQTRRR